MQSTPGSVHLLSVGEQSCPAAACPCIYCTEYRDIVETPVYHRCSSYPPLKQDLGGIGILSEVLIWIRDDQSGSSAGCVRQHVSDALH